MNKNNFKQKLHLLVTNIHLRATAKKKYYGLAEHHKKHDYKLHSRLIELFRDILHIDLTGYIELADIK